MRCNFCPCLRCTCSNASDNLRVVDASFTYAKTAVAESVDLETVARAGVVKSGEAEGAS